METPAQTALWLRTLHPMVKIRRNVPMNSDVKLAAEIPAILGQGQISYNDESVTKVIEIA
jgi:hypothetical protein